MRQRLIDANKLMPNAELKGRYDLVSAWDIANQPIVEAIPKEWIINWLTKQTIPALHTYDDYEAVNMMLDEWEKENDAESYRTD